MTNTLRPYGGDQRYSETDTAKPRAFAVTPEETRRALFGLIDELYRLADRIGAEEPDAAQARADLNRILESILRDGKR